MGYIFNNDAESSKLRRMFCWDSIIFDDFQNGGIYKYGKSGLDLFVPYCEISGFENYGNCLCFILRNDSYYMIDFLNESDCEDAIEYLTMEVGLFFDERHYLRHHGEIDLYYQQKMLIGDTDIFVVDHRSFCLRVIRLDNIKSVEIDGADSLKLTDFPDVGESWRVGSSKCESYGATHYFCCAKKSGLDTAYEIINRAIEERKRK